MIIINDATLAVTRINLPVLHCPSEPSHYETFKEKNEGWCNLPSLANPILAIKYTISFSRFSLFLNFIYYLFHIYIHTYTHKLLACNNKTVWF